MSQTYMKYTHENDDFFYEENNANKNGSSLRQDNELFDEEEYIAHKLVRVQRIEKKSEENWEISIDKKVLITIRGKQLNAKEREFLRTVDGLLFIKSQFEGGINSAAAMKEQIKKRCS